MLALPFDFFNQTARIIRASFMGNPDESGIFGRPLCRFFCTCNFDFDRFSASRFCLPIVVINNFNNPAGRRSRLGICIVVYVYRVFDGYRQSSLPNISKVMFYKDYF